MLLVAGLGNPGAEYAETRHNIGVLVAERLARLGGAPWRDKFNGRVAACDLWGERLVLLTPLTYMNESGRSVGPALRFHKLTAAELLVVHDELDLPLGTVRLKLGGGEAGHRGLKSVTAHVGTQEYARLRLGIGRPPSGFRGQVADFVLQGFPSSDRPLVERAVEQAVEAVQLMVERGLSEAMNKTNQRDCAR